MDKESADLWLQVFGITSIVFGAIMGIGTLVLMLIASLLVPTSEFPVQSVGVFLLIIGLILGSITALYIVNGIGILRRRSWAVVTGWLTSILSLFSIPFGTAYGILGIIILGVEDETKNQLRKG